VVPSAQLSSKAASIIAEGVNQVTLTNDPTAHAKMLAIRQACQKLRALSDCKFQSPWWLVKIAHQYRRLGKPPPAAVAGLYSKSARRS
jgi:hypothetical protein